MNQPLLSVIVPCYNVEKYIDKCVLSIVGQTYSNLEILLVNDGSTDETGDICDKWQTKDNRIRVIHKQNEGSSYARKTGVENATAEYVGFVDADDWIAPDMYTDMMNALLSTNTDIAECDLCFVYEDGRIVHRIQEHDASMKIMGRIENVCGILENQWRMSFYTKIFKRHLFDDLVFPKIGYGDDVIVYRLYHHASQSVFLNSEYYFYLQRNDSLCRDKNIPAELKKITDWNDALYESYDFVKRHPEYHNALIISTYYALCVGLRLLQCMVAYPQQFTSKYFSFKAEQLRSIPLPEGDWIPRKDKIELYLLKINPVLYKILRMFYNRVIQFTNWLKITDKPICLLINEHGFYWSYFFIKSN